MAQKSHVLWCILAAVGLALGVWSVNAPKQAMTCPYCGATTTPDANGC